MAVVYVTHRRDTPMKVLLQVGDNLLGIERGHSILSKPVSQSARQRDRPSDELVRLCCVAAPFTTGIIFRSK